ncbi:MAG: histidine kinase [Pseudomonadales bacterium]
MPSLDRLEPRTDERDTYFYLPDLCSITALLPLILVGQLLALVLTLAASPLPAFNWPRFSLLACEILWIVLVGAAVLCRLRPLLPRVTATTGVALCFASLLAVIAAVAIAGQWLMAYLTLNWSQSAWLMIQHLAIGGILSGLVLRYFYLQQQLHLQREIQIRATLQARFQSLQSRIRPHFLFNSMNSIASLIDSDPDTAERVVEDMSALFRASLSAAEDLVALEQEISLCQRYIHIEQLRLGERLQVQWDIQLQNPQVKIPSFSLQPLIENAIYHGIQPLTRGGTINITLSDNNDILRCVVSNPFTEETANIARSGNGMALENLEQRLKTHYGSAINFSILREKNLFTVQFSIPLHTGARA